MRQVKKKAASFSLGLTTKETSLQSCVLTEGAYGFFWGPYSQQLKSTSQFLSWRAGLCAQPLVVVFKSCTYDAAADLSGDPNTLLPCQLPDKESLKLFLALQLLNKVNEQLQPPAYSTLMVHPDPALIVVGVTS